MENFEETLNGLKLESMEVDIESKISESFVYE